MQSNYLPAAAQKTTHFKKDRRISIARAHFLPNRKCPHMSNPGMAFSSNQKRQSSTTKKYIKTGSRKQVALLDVTLDPHFHTPTLGQKNANIRPNKAVVPHNRAPMSHKKKHPCTGVYKKKVKRCYKRLLFNDEINIHGIVLRWVAGCLCSSPF